ncbi:hypothetical protein QJQ45_015847 [Haematococcus lacustris]|nr:hypothetical protein QJQ45_015847 [Haematococcus lacustris]
MSPEECGDEDAPGPSAAVRKLAGLSSSVGRSVRDRAAGSKSVWLDAWSDPVACLSAYSPCMHTCDLFGDGDWRLVVADEDRKLKVWKGTQKQSDHTLLDTPVAITSFISDTTPPRLPSLAVAAGSHIFIYRNLRPYYKFVLPAEDVNTEEQECWQKVMAGEMVVGEALALVTQLQDAGVVLTSRSLQLLNIADPAKKLSFVEQWQGQPLTATTVITCMETMKLAIDEPDAVSCLVVATESGRILILNPAGTAVAKNIWVGVTAAFLCVAGELEVDYRIAMAGRDGKLYLVRNGELQQTIIQLEAPAVGLVRMGPHTMVGCMNSVVHSYTNNGHKNFTIYLPAPILAMQRLEVTAQRMTKALVVALRNGEIRVYNGRSLVGCHTVPSPTTGLLFGRYGREDNTLITLSKSGALDIKMLPRNAVLEAPPGPAGPPPEQDIPLQVRTEALPGSASVPKKTRLYVEQTQREREQAADMHRVFQRDLARLRLTTARSYVKILTDGLGASAFTSSASLTLNLTVQGLGPHFKLVMTLRNDGSSHVRDVPVMLMAPEAMYRLDRKLMVLPMLAPGLTYIHEVDVTCVNPAAGCDTITVVLLSKSSSLPIMQAQIRMPVSELADE